MLKLDPIKQALPEEQAKLKEAGESLDLTALRGKLADLNKQAEDPNLWGDPEKAQQLLKKKKSVEDTVAEYDGLEKEFSDIADMIEIAEELEDEDEADGIIDAFRELQEKAEEFRLKTLLDGKYCGVKAGNSVRQVSIWLGKTLTPRIIIISSERPRMRSMRTAVRPHLHGS